jgi:nucleoside-diphosphate-sugar epimerase
MRILITGGSGYIGSVLVPKLLAWERHLQHPMKPAGVIMSTVPAVTQLTVVDSLRYNQNSLTMCHNDPRFRFIMGDVENDDLMFPLYTEADVILPMAGIVGFPEAAQYPELAWRLNRDVIVRMCDFLRIGELRPKVVFYCTNSGYGSYPDGRAVTEVDELKPISIYGMSKVAGEKAIMNFGGVSLRLATVMGISPFMRVGLLVNTFCWFAAKQRNIVLYEKHNKRNYIHVEDVAAATLWAIDHYDDMAGQAYNLGLSTANLSKAELAANIAEQTELHILEAPLMTDPDKRDYLVSNAKIEATGWRPGWSLEDTIQSLLRFYRGVTEHSANVYFGTT